MLSADGGGAAGKLPVLNIGCRGIAALQFSLRTARKDAHSGKVGGAMRNALHEMARLIATLHDEQGRVAVEGFEGRRAADHQRAARGGRLACRSTRPPGTRSSAPRPSATPPTPCASAPRCARPSR